MRRDRAFQVIAVAYFLAALFFFRQVLPDLAGNRWGGILLFAGLTALAETLQIRLPGSTGTISVGFVMWNATALLFGPGTGALIAGLATLQAKDFRRDLFLVLANQSQMALSAGLAGLTYLGLGGTPNTPELGRDLLPGLASTLVVFAVNISSVVLLLTVKKGLPLFKTWRKYTLYFAPNFLGTAPLALILAAIFNSVGYFGVIYFFLPLLVAQYAFKLQTDMQRSFLDTITAMTATLDAKDSYTAGHSARVGEMAARVAQEMGLPEKRVELIRYAGILHDIGKIGIRDQILFKPGRYTAEEYDQMKTHPVLGGRILAHIQALGEINKWVTHHHERWDGQGYPDGLAGEEIPLESRIIAICDAFDAMISRRAYKESMPWDKACAELRRCAGEQFDPAVADVLLRLAGDPEFRASLQNAVETAQTQAAFVLENRSRGKKNAPSGGIPKEG